MGAQIKKEISIMKSVAHDHVVAILDVFATSSKIFIVLELVDGGELFEYLLENKRLAEAEARHFLLQIVDGLGYCHSQGIFHRDLKPENLLLDLKGNIKISDFGLSTLYVGGADGGASDDRVELLHTTCGTPNYVAPEVLENRGYDGRQADVWSVGIVLFVLVAGYLPFEEDTMPALFDKIKRADFNMPDCDDGGLSPQRAKNPYARGNRGTPLNSPAAPRTPSSALFSRDLIELLNHVLIADPKKRWTLDQVKNCDWVQGHAERPAYIHNRAEAAATPDRKTPSKKTDSAKPKADIRVPTDENSSPNDANPKTVALRPPKVDSRNPLHESTDAKAVKSLLLPPPPPFVQSQTTHESQRQQKYEVEVGFALEEGSRDDNSGTLLSRTVDDQQQKSDFVASKDAEGREDEEEKQLLSSVTSSHSCCTIQ